jgi:hypothetical protein
MPWSLSINGSISSDQQVLIFMSHFFQNLILLGLGCNAPNLSQQIRKQKPPVPTWRYYIRDKLSQRNIFLYILKDTLEFIERQT